MPAVDQDHPMTIVVGPAPGLLGDIVALHGRYYASQWNFPLAFEVKVAAEMAEFFGRYDPARDVVMSVRDADRWLGSITLDGSDPGLDDGQAHLRWFILDPVLRGRGLGKRFVHDTIDFARRAGMRSIYLTTFRGLDAASGLYAAAGFEVLEEHIGETWGARVAELRLELAL